MDPLGLPPDEFRRLGHRVVEIVAAHLEELERSPVIRTGEPARLRASLGGPLPEEPSDPDAALVLLAEEGLGHMQNPGHPRYFARIPGPAAGTAVLGEWLGTGFNSIAASWGGGSGPTQVELTVVDWLRELVGLPPGTEGVLLSGGSLASLTALAAVRARDGEGVVYLSDQAHSSIARALRALSVAEVRVLPADPDGRLDPGTVRPLVDRDADEGLRPGILVATAGTTNTGAVDPLDALADLCAEQEMWLHVDGAYGAAAAACPDGRAALAGLGRADSLVLDPHKWLFQPYDAGALLVREPGVLAHAFAMTPEYLADVRARTGEVDLRDLSPELSRRSRALKLWLTFRVHGAAAVRAAIARGLALAEEAEKLVREDPGWEVVTPARLGIVTFARAGAAPGDHARRAAAVAASGHAAVTSTTVGGREVLRLCTINPTTRSTDLASTLRALAAA